MTALDTDIAWLAGIIDGEGCFTVKRPPKYESRRKGYQLWLVLCNTSGPMMVRACSVFDAMGVEYPPPRVVFKGKGATRLQFWLHIQKRDAVLRATETLLPHLTAKRAEAEIVIWYLRRAIKSKKHRVTPEEAVLLEAMADIKRNGGVAPDGVADLVRLYTQ